MHWHTPHCLTLGKDQVLLHEVVQPLQLRLAEAVLGDGDIPLADHGSAPVRQTEIGLRRIHPFVDDFGRRLPGDGPMHLVLHGFEKADAQLLRGIVVDACRVDIRYFLVEPPLRCADVLNPPHQLIEVIEGLIRTLQPLVIEEETLHDVFPQQPGGPDTEAGGHRTFHPVAHRNDGIEIVETGRVILPVGGSSKGILYY